MPSGGMEDHSVDQKGEEKMSKKGYYGSFGGRFVAESLMNTLEELDLAFEEAKNDAGFIEEYNYYLKQYVGREPSCSSPCL